MKKVALELGGKNPNIVFADADLEAALDNALTAVFLHSGQVCSAGARLLVQESIHDQFVDALVERADGSGWAGRSTRTPRPAAGEAAHRDKVEAYVAPASPRAPCCAAVAPPDDPALADGFYYLPTVLDGCHRTCRSSRTSRSGRSSPSRRSAPRTRRSRSPTTPSTAWPARCGPRTPGKGAPGRRPAPDGHGVDQRLPPVRPPGRVGRIQAVRHRSGARPAGLDEYRETKHVWHNIRPAGNAGSPGSGLRRWRGQRYDFVIVGGGSAGCALANRLSRRLRHQRPGPRGGPLRLPDRPVHPHAGRAADPDRQPALRLEVRVRPRAAHGRPAGLPRPRQGARRLEQHQRDDLPARQPARLRALGRRAGHGGVGLRPLPAVLQADGELPGRRRRLARRRRPAEARAGPATNPLFDAFFAAGRRPATRSPTTSTATARRGSRGSTATSTAAAGSPRPGPTCTRSWTERTSPCARSRLVTSVRFEGTRATGVEYLRGRPPTPPVDAGEVILCGGAINSPQLLQLSGVGNESLLRSTASRSSTTCPAWERTSRTTSRSTSSTPPSSRSPSLPASRGASGPRSPTSGCSSARASEPPTTSRAVVSRGATTTSTTRT